MIVRHSALVRVCHWVNAICFVVLLMSGMQIFNASPLLTWAQTTNFERPFFSLSARRDDDGNATAGLTTIFGHSFTTTGVLGKNTHDLLPLPYTEQALKHVVRRVKVVQDALERPFGLENPSSYVEFRSSTMTEAEFLARVAVEADCGILLDVNNVYVSSFNHGFDPREYLDAIPHERVLQYHLAGHTNHGTHIIDTHNDHVIERVWQLYQRSIQRTGNVSTLLEWDADIPAFEVVHREALKARRYRAEEQESRRENAAPVPGPRGARAGYRTGIG